MNYNNGECVFCYMDGNGNNRTNHVIDVCMACFLVCFGDKSGDTSSHLLQVLKSHLFGDRTACHFCGKNIAIGFSDLSSCQRCARN